MKDLIKPRTIFAFMFYGAFCYLILRQISIPQELNTIVSMLMGYYFGSRKQKSEVKDGTKIT